MVIWLPYPILMAWLNAWLIKHNKKPIHWLNALITCIAAAGLAWLRIDSHPWYFTFFSALIVYWWVFDSSLNLMRGLDIHFLGDGSVLDRLSKNAPPQVIFFLKGLLAIGLFWAYYANY